MSNIHAFLDRFIASNSNKDLRHDDILIDTFGDSPDMADQLLELVRSGTKTATCSSLIEWQDAFEKPLVPGTLTAILDGEDIPRCVVETTHVDQITFQEVTADFARAEGEHGPDDLTDDQVLQHWRDGHWAYYQRKLSSLGHTPSMDMVVLCERFKVVYAEWAN